MKIFALERELSPDYSLKRRITIWEVKNAGKAI